MALEHAREADSMELVLLRLQEGPRLIVLLANAHRLLPVRLLHRLLRLLLPRR